MTDAEPTGSLPGAWLSISAAARTLGITPRAVRGRIKHNTIEWHPKGNGGREVFVSATGSLPGGSQGLAPLATLALPGPAVVPVAELDALRVELLDERQRREAAERDAAVARREVELVRETAERDAAAARREIELVREILATLERDRDRLLAEIADLRRPWIARWLDALRQRRAG